ncbi:MAG: serine protease [Phenylobacterium zucineum]|nr:MAG: serine protease [Phenylobacterium zucineum]
MPNKLDETIGALGYAKVLVTLSDGAAASMNANVALAENFILPPQSAALAATTTEMANLAAVATPQRMKVYPNLGLALGITDAAGAAALRASAAVHKIDEAPELSLIRPVDVHAAPPQALAAAATQTWGLRRIGAQHLWALGFRGAGVRVAHLDTGVDGQHPAFAGAIAAYAEFDWMGNQVPGAAPHDTGNHGTHTAGTILGRGDGPTGAFGVAPEAMLISATVIEGGQVIDRILAGMDWAIGQNARILNMSLGLRGFTSAFQVVVDALRARNVLPVIAVGNEGPNTSRSPGNYANVLSIGAMSEAETVAAFSGSQTFDRMDDRLVPDLVGPGVDVVSAMPGGGFGVMSGSSMATPHIAGLAALLAQAAPGATATKLEKAILQSCVRPGTMSEDRANRGVPDGLRALQALGVAIPAAASAPARTKKASKK